MATMHERYLAGDRTRIWHELRQLGDRVQEPGLYADAQAVCDEMARRARYNIETLVSRLEGHGYVFHSNDERRNRVRPFYPATERGGLALAWLGERIGPAPLALSSWLRLVGDVWLVGTHPQWSDSASADPLVIEVEGSSVPDTSVEQYLEEEYQGWAELSEDNPGEAVSFELPLAPDSLTKADVSGGIYRMPLPDGTAEGLIVGEVAIPFVSYLNWVFRNGGFPGPAVGDAQWGIKRDLAIGMLEL